MFNFYGLGVFKNVCEVMSEIIKCPKKEKEIMSCLVFEKKNFFSCYFFKPKIRLPKCTMHQALKKGKLLSLQITKAHHYQNLSLK